MSKRKLPLRVVASLNVAALGLVLAQVWAIARGPESPESVQDLSGFEITTERRPTERGIDVISGEFDRPLPEVPQAEAPTPVVETPLGPRPALNLVAVLDDTLQGRPRAAIVAFSDGRQRMVRCDDFLDPRAQEWQIRSLRVERSDAGVRGVIELISGERVESYQADLFGL